jgi:hypothetical protein
MDVKHRLLGSAVLALVLVAAVVTVLAQAGLAPTSPAQEGARLRFIHAAPDAPPVDLLVDGSDIFTTTAFGEITEYTAVSTGTHTVAVEPATGGSALLSQTLVITETDYTLAAAGTLGASGETFELLAIPDDNTAPPPRMVRARFVHLVPDAPFPVTVAIKGGDTLFENVTYRDVTGYETLPAGTHTLQALVLGTEVTTGTVTVMPNNVYSFFAIGQASGPEELDILQVLDASYNHPIWLPLVLGGS